MIRFTPKFCLAASLSLFTCMVHSSPSLADSRWNLQKDGGIQWRVQPGQGHRDHIEMSGRKVSLILTYGVEASGALIFRKQLVFPTLRTIPNNTHGSLTHTFESDGEPSFMIDGQAAPEAVQSFYHHGVTVVQSELAGGAVTLTRTIFPSTAQRAVVEQFVFKNQGDKNVKVSVEKKASEVRTPADKGVQGVYVLSQTPGPGGEFTLRPGQQASTFVTYQGRPESEAPAAIDAVKERRQREARVAGLEKVLQLRTPDPVLNRAFDFAKLRTAESIFETKGGLMHSPGGGAYYAAIWANDQAEYANPFFGYLGDETARASAIRSFEMFADYINPEFKPIPSSIIAEGIEGFGVAGDRGDMAMIAYGAARFALANGDKTTAEKMWPLISWCVEYCRRQINADGVVASDSDELENRFPAGKANLNTSSLYYDSLNSMVFLGRALNKPEKEVSDYQTRARSMKSAIERYFGAPVEGFQTYRYYAGNDILRSWICVPLTMGIFDRKAGTLDAIFSPRLWTDDGLLTAAGDKTFWDRSTLYGLRGAFAAGDTDRALGFLTAYSNRRLLGEHVPYPIEAYPEGNQRHLAAEGALYCRVFTEGLFGLRPTGLRSFTVVPRLPTGWNEMSLRRMRAFDSTFDLTISRRGAKVEVRVDRAGLPPLIANGHAGETVAVDLGGS
jgi:hypothetical protein